MPEPMAKLTVVSLRDFDEKILQGLGGLKVLQLKKVEGAEFFGLKSEELKARQEYEELYGRLNLLRKRLGVEEMPRTEGLAEISETEVKDYVEGYERKLDNLLSRLSDERQRLSKLKETRRRLRILEESNVEVGDLGRFQDEFVKAGLIRRELSPKLDKYLFHSESLKYNIVNVSPSESFIVLSGSAEVEEQVTNVLSSLNFMEFAFPKSVSKETATAISQIERNMTKIKLKIDGLENKREDINRELTGRLTLIEHSILKKMSQRIETNLEKMRDILGSRYESVEEKEYEDLYERFNHLRERLGVKEIPETKRPVEMSDEELKSRIESYEKILDSLLSELEDAKKTLGQLEERKKRLEILRDNSIEVGELGRTREGFVRAGLISKELGPRLDKYFSSLKYLTYKIAPVSSLDDFIILMGMSEVEDWVLNILSMFSFREFAFAPSIPKENAEALLEVDEEIRKIEFETDRLEGERDKLKHEFKEKLSTVGLRLRDYVRLSEARSLILGSENVSVFQGWIPRSEGSTVKGFFEDMNDEIRNGVVFTIEEPGSDEEPPTLIRTPRVIGPYSVLTRMLGIPNYREIDPTVISTVLWVTMFGIMFPDLGQGILISVLGAVLAFAVKKSFFGLNLVTVGKLWIGLGVSAAFFGALFGEVFLVENVISPLWLRPLEGGNVWLLLKIAIFFGVAQIFLGLTFGVINHLKRGDIIESLVGEHSVASLTLFGGLLILIARFWTIRNLSSMIHWTTLIPFAALTAILMKSTVKRMTGRTVEGGVMEDFGSAIEMFISLLTNMVSYARLAGFSFAHVALAAVVQVLMTKSVALGLTGLVLMNLLALTIELLVVMIQALRLLYYEFSTKFFSGAGMEYRPLILGGKLKSLNEI